jgi:hypothetical protein
LRRSLHSCSNRKTPNEPPSLVLRVIPDIPAGDGCGRDGVVMATNLKEQTMNQTTMLDEPIDGEMMVEHEPSTALVPREISPMSLIESAIARGATDQLEKLLALQERWEANQARKAYHEAMAKFRENHIVVSRSTTVSDGPLKGKTYAKLIDFVGAAAPHLSPCGLTATWEITKDEKDWIEVACIMSHVAGHQTRTTMGGPPDIGGAKNAIQARSSTVSYLQKYTLKMATGLAEQSDDNDANGPPDTLTPEQVGRINDALGRMPQEEQEKVLARLFKWLQVGEIDKIPASEFQKALAGILKEGDKFHS